MEVNVEGDQAEGDGDLEAVEPSSRRFDVDWAGGAPRRTTPSLPTATSHAPPGDTATVTASKGNTALNSV